MRVPFFRAIAAVLAFSAVVAGALWAGGFFVKRPPCVAPEARPFDSVARLEPMFGGEILDMPVQLLEDPSEPGAWFTVYNSGVIERRRGTRVEAVFDISDRILAGHQWGLQEIALHPNFPRDGRIFATYFAPGNVSKVSMFRTRLDGDPVSPSNETLFFEEAQKYTWHPIGGLRFGPDGYLYIAWGFGEAWEDYEKQLRGKMLRIDVDRVQEGAGYGIPPDNPWIGTDYDPAAWASGLRNPWRFSFDENTGDLWLGDVGEQGFEEIDRIVAGANYGWPVWEGTACRLPDRCDEQPFEAPVYEHSHAEVCAPIGGFVYRGSAIEPLRGKYVYGDHCTGMLWAFDPTADPVESEPVAELNVFIASFAEDRDGELYVVSSQAFDENGELDPRRGAAYRLVASQVDTAATEPSIPSLVELGCDPTPWRSPGNMIEYAINHPAWEDGAEIRRFLTTTQMPRRAGIEESVTPRTGAVAMKSYFEGGVPTQTQMLTRRRNGLWDAYLFEWNEEGTDAFASPTAAAQCARCHNPETGTLRAMFLSQLNRDFYRRRQIRRWVDLGILYWDGPPPFERLPAYPRIDDDSADVARRARVYLDVNCSPCHQPGGRTGAAEFDVRLTTPLSRSGLCDQPASIQLEGHGDARLLAPGSPQQSMISIRMHKTDLSSMPPMRRSVDPHGTRVIDEWIESLGSCPGEAG